MACLLQFLYIYQNIIGIYNTCLCRLNAVAVQTLSDVPKPPPRVAPQEVTTYTYRSICGTTQHR